MRSPLLPFVASVFVSALVVGHVSTASADAPAATPAQILSHATDTDPWGMGGVEAASRAIVTEKGGRTRELSFDAKSLRYSGQLSKSLLRFKAPADVSGMKFLQIQKAAEDDDRHLYVPELKRSRRIAAGTRSEVFMGTVYTYADVDRRDLRGAKAVAKADETVGKYECFHIDAIPQNGDAQYSKVEIWSRKDNLIPLKMVMYGKTGSPVKSLVTKEIQRLKERWHITRSVMTDHATGKTTEILLEKVEPRDDIDANLFNVRTLEKD
jgi:hypothetical protein